MSQTDTSSADALLLAATEVFLEQGFSGARVDEIAERARVNKAMIYYHFESKHGLYRAVLHRLLAGVGEELAAQAAAERDPRRRLIAFYGGIARLFSERPALPRIMLREILAGGENVDPETTRTLAGFVELVAKAIEDGRQEGSVRPVHPLIVHLSAMGPLILFFVTQAFRDRVLPAALPGSVQPTPEAMLDHLAVLIERGLEPVASGSETAQP